MRENKSFRLDRLYPAILFMILVVLFFNEIFFSGKVFIARVADCYYSHYSWAAYFKNMVSEGILPLWNPLSFCGCPYGANSTSNVCILNLLVYVFKNLNLAWNIRILSNVFLSALFTFLYMRKVGFSKFSGLVSGIIYGFCPFDTSSFTINFVESYSFFLPLFLFLIESYCSSKKIVYVILTGLSFAFFILSSNPQFSLYVGIFFILYVLFRFRSALGLFIVLFSVGSVSFYTFRLLEFFYISQRPSLWFINILLPTHLINIIFPFLFESPFRPETNFFFAHLFQEVTRIFLHTDKLLYIFPPYISVIGLTFCLFSLKEKGVAKFYKTTALVILIYLVSYPLSFPFYKLIPYIGKMPNIERIGVFITFSLAILAGIGSDVVLRRKINLKPVVLFYTFISCIIIDTCSAIGLFIRFKGDAIRSFFINYINSRVVGSPQHLQSLDFYLRRIDEFFIFINQWTNLRSPSVILPLIFISLSLLILYMWQKSYIRKNLFCVFSIALLSIDIFIFFKAAVYRTAEPRDLKVKSKTIEFLKNDNDMFRIAPISDDTEYTGAVSILPGRGAFSPEANIIYNIASIEGYDSFFLKRYQDFFYTFIKGYDVAYPGVMVGPESNFDYDIGNFLNVKYFITTKNKHLKKNLPLCFEDENNRVYFNKFYYPRAFMVYDYVVLKDKKRILFYLKANKARLSEIVVLEESPSLPISKRVIKSKKSVAHVKRYEPHFIEIEVTTPANGLLVLTDCYYPGWGAFVDDGPVSIFRADYTFRAIEIPKGTHKVRFLYSPSSLKTGLVVNIIFIMLGLVLVIYFKRKS